MAEDLGERTEDPTPRRLSEARDKGQVAKSTDLTSAVLLTGAVVLVVALLPWMVRSMGLLLRYHLDERTLGGLPTLGRITPDLTLTALEAARVLAPAMALMALVAFLANVAQIGLHLSSRALEPKWSNLNLIKGLGKIFSKRTLVKGGLDIGKFLLIGAVAALVIVGDLPLIAALPHLHLEGAFAIAGELVRELAIWILLVLIALGLLDFLYQRWQHRQDLRMTKHEVKDEFRSTEGDTETKARRIRMARQIAMQRLQQDVPKADVVVTNPTHYAVALRYDQTMRAPKVVAKGADYLALKIRYLAVAHGVPIVERPPLARALYNEARVGREINPAHYEAVAEVLAYVYRLEGRLAS
ncbi:MAG TPA: flagellar biosynthesis protein FlhB [Phycisphaerales bacterium]|nr:flagellar biosynthesis protein FlhB [Phycisphaerales bacterium]